MLAHYLASENPTFSGHSISIVGFSLGCQVTISLINRLAKIGHSNLIQNVYLLAGATFISDKNYQKVRQRIQNTVSGRITNVYSKNDDALRAFNLTVSQENIIGRGAYYENSKNNHSCPVEARKKFRLDNYDVTQIVNGHMDYRSKLDIVLQFIKFDS